VIRGDSIKDELKDYRNQRLHSSLNTQAVSLFRGSVNQKVYICEMKKLLFPCFLGLAVFSCKPSVQNENVSDASTVDSIKSVPDTKSVNIPEKDSTWVDHQINETKPKLIISTPKGIKIFADSYSNSINVMLDENQSMFIQAKPIDIQKEKQWYLDSRTDLQWLIDTDTEVLYTGTDPTAPKGYQNTNSFFAVKKIGEQDFSTNVDGIVVKDESHIYNLTTDQCQLLLGIFRTLRKQ
jgi:hypothetical protein